MQNVNEINAYKSLASAILLSALNNIERHSYIDRSFVNSDWCLDLCDMAGIVHHLYIKKAQELTEKYCAIDYTRVQYKY